METLNKWYSKNKNRLEVIILFFFLAYLGQKTLDWLFDLSVAASFQRFYNFISYQVSIPISFIVVGLVFTALVVKGWKILKIKRSGLRIVNARYGHGDSWVDITSELNDKVMNDSLLILISNDLAGDPVPGIRKVASVHYELGTKKLNANVNEGEVLKLPEPIVVTSRNR